ncbi:hypothetical protein [Paraclostridium tenue]|uniref:SPOR domain-containing protein n=1 Tax=Paraclostridium tenue TaxID=1737 RepID=A0ABP3XFD8_9FIRM
MNKRRNIYRGINKRRNNVAKGFTLGLVIVGIAGGVMFIKSKDFSLSEKINNLNFFDKKESKIQEFSYNDLIDKSDENKSKETASAVKSENSKLATVSNWDMYSIQIAAIDNKEELNKIKDKLNELKIPFSIVDIDNVKKVQTSISFKEEESRKQLENIKKDFSDAFISKLEVPLLSLEYTEKYAYVEDICNDLNELINNFKEESSFWDKSESDINKANYKNIIKNKLEVLGKLEKHTKKIDYKGMKGFKENLTVYIKSVRDKSNESLKNVEKDQYYISKSLFMSSMQEYYSFVNSIKTI